MLKEESKTKLLEEIEILRKAEEEDHPTIFSSILANEAKGLNMQEMQELLTQTLGQRSPFWDACANCNSWLHTIITLGHFQELQKFCVPPYLTASLCKELTEIQNSVSKEARVAYALMKNTTNL